AAMTTAGEYFFVENRNNKGFFESVFPEHGILISHYDQSEKGTYYNEGQYYTYWIEQRGFDPAIHDTYTADTIYRDAGQAPYSAGDDYEFTNLTKAGANVNGSTTNFGPYIIAISKPGDTMWFTVDNATVPAGASFAYKSHIEYDTITNYGNNNGFAEPDELVDLKVTIKNVGGAATGITAKLRSTQTGLVLVTDSTAAYPNIGSLASAANSDNFRVKVLSGTPSDTTLYFTLAVTSAAGSNETEFGIKINSTPTDTTFILRTKSTALTDAAALDIYWLGDFGIDDWAIIAAGSGLGNVYGTGSKQIWYWTLSDNGATLEDYFSYTSGNYAQCMDHDAAGNVWISCGDSALRYDIVSQSQISRTRWSNTDYAGTVMKRVRGVTFDNNDSMFGYWQTYGTFEESLLGQRKVLNGTATRFWGVPLLDGTSYGGKWNNGRGIEWDGTCFWSVNIFENFIFRKTPYSAGFPQPDSNAFKTISTISCPSVQGNYPAYDIAFQGISGDGITPAVPFGKNNKYYIWTLNMDNSEVTKIDVTSLVLPKAVAGFTVSRVPTSTTVNLSWTANAASDFVTKYVVYRSTTPNFYAKDSDSVATTTDTSLVNIVPVAKVDYYYKVKAVNYQGYSLTPSVEKLASGATATMEASLIANQVNNDINLEWTAQTTAGKSWEITRTSDKETAVIGTVDIKTNKFTDSSVPSNGTYTYNLTRVDADGNKVVMGETKVKFFSNLVFGISPIKQNPVKNSFTLYYSIDREEQVSLNIYSITGQVVMTLADGVSRPGFYTARIDAEKLSSGVYFAVLKQGNKEAKERITFLK
ncbi:MAG: T9SS type A sorting domain-containing protein, partial [bacterium]|nr:T9SS type A sorting domain-containing protein [bacterium]